MAIFAQLSRAEQSEIMAASLNAGAVQYYCKTYRKYRPMAIAEPFDFGDTEYRLTPKEFDWADVPQGFDFAMTDEDGDVRVYEHNPEVRYGPGHTHGNCWYEFLGGPDCSLIRRPGTEFIPFGRLSSRDRQTLYDAYIGGANIEVRGEYGGWSPCEVPQFRYGLMYRVMVEGPKPITFDWSHLKSDVKFVAMDKNGFVFAYTSKPEWHGDEFWIRTDNTAYVRIDLAISLDKGTVSPENSLIERPE